MTVTCTHLVLILLVLSAVCAEEQFVHARCVQTEAHVIYK